VEPEKLDLRSHDITEDKRKELLNLFPEIRTEGGKLDFDRLKLALGESVDIGKERYGMNWPGKADCFKTIQMPSLATLRPCPEESINFNMTENLIIEGDNLEVLKLLQKSYLGKVKMIYIDPPYNTGNDFIYPDNYTESLQTYLEYTGQVDAEGRKFGTNTDTDGRFHSKWLNMMYPRLYLARNLLRKDGIIFISIDENEVANLRKLCDEIFGEENFRNTIIVRRGIKNVQAQFDSISNLASGHEYVLCYSAHSDFRLSKLSYELEGSQAGKWDTFWRGTDRPTLRYELFGKTPETGQWRWSKERTLQAVRNYKQFADDSKNKLSLDDFYLNHLQSTNVELNFVRLNEEGVVQYYVPPRDYKLISDNWMDVSIKGNEIGFDTEKHIDLMKRITKWMIADGDIVLDFFAGSGTTAQAVLDLNKQDDVKRKFILIQLPEPTEREDYPTIADMCKERVRRVIQKLNDEESQKSTQQSLALTPTPALPLSEGAATSFLPPSRGKVRMGVRTWTNGAALTEGSKSSNWPSPTSRRGTPRCSTKSVRWRNSSNCTWTTSARVARRRISSMNSCSRAAFRLRRRWRS
jgi:adenine-specific DNA-methyltransferase